MFYEFDLYSPSRPKCKLDLSDNTNRWGSAPSALNVLSDVSDFVSRYPEPYSAELKSALAEYWNLGADEVVVGCGSDDLLNSAMRAFGQQGDTLLYCTPTFGMAEVFARVNRLETIAVEFLASGNLDVDVILSTKADVVYLCSPNNPTGLAIDEQSVRSFLDHFPGIVILDEAYGEFCDQRFAAMTAEYDRLFVVRTFSKAWGLAGLRIGYGVGAPDLVEAVEKARGPYKVSKMGESAAIAALTNDQTWMKVYVDAAVASRERLTHELNQIGIFTLPSVANFVLVPVADAAFVFEQLLKNEILVRAYNRLPAIGDAIRITVGPWDEMQTFLDAFKEIQL